MEKVFIAIEISTEDGPGSSPSIRVNAFKDKDGLEKFKAKWVEENKRCGRRYNEELDYWSSNGWSYELDIHETEIV